MCGILGIAYLTEAGRRKVVASPSTRAIAARGPDNVGVLRESQVELHHTRLAVIDGSESSHQPLVGAHTAVICNGEIYNHRELRRRLEESYRYSTTSDCEAVNAVYETSGTAGFAELDGMCSFALLDRRERRLILHRDHVGKKPLFFYSDGDVAMFASSVSAIAENLVATLALSREQLDYYISTGFCHPAQSIVEGVTAVRPGEIIDIDLQSGRISRTMQNKPQADVDHIEAPTYEDAIGRTSALLDAAIAKRLEGVKVPVVLFSGGVDSTLLASRMLRIRSDVMLISAKQPVRWLNDEPYAREAGRQLHAKVHFVPFWGRTFYDDVEQTLAAMDQPFSLASLFYNARLTKLARSVNNVLFTGDGADEVFFGYDPLDAWVGEGAPTPPSIASGPRFTWPLSSHGKWVGNTALIGHQFVKVDKATAENQVEARCPFLDWDLMAFVRQIPLTIWRSRPEIKFLLKDLVVREGFSQSFAFSRKRGWLFPFRTCMLPHFPAMLAALRNETDLLRSLDLADSPPSMLQLYSAFPKWWRLYVLARFVQCNAFARRGASMTEQEGRQAA